MFRTATRAALLAAILFLLPAAAGADRRYFLRSYTPYLAPSGELEIETWLTARTGRQDPARGTAWEPRVELEYTLTDRLASAAYLNFSRPPGGPLGFESPSLEFIYRLAEPSVSPEAPAVYLETSETGKELELESKLLMARRANRVVSALNLIGEFEFRHNDEERLASGAVLNNEFAGEVAGGLSYELGPGLALGLEARYLAEYPNFGRRSAALFSLGPSINLQSGEVQLALGILPQIWGSPAPSGDRNLLDFDKLEIRAILGIDL